MIAQQIGRPVARTVASAITTATGSFSPFSLFVAGEVGAWYDPSDLSTLFQDHSGTTPVTAVDQSVALMLDKSKGLARGADIVTNGSGSTTSGWTAVNSTLSTVGGYLRVTATGGTQARATQSLTTIVGRAYEVTFVGRRGAGTTQVGAFGGGGSSLYTASGSDTSLRFVLFASATSTTLTLELNGAPADSDYAEFKTIVCRELQGLHVGQTTASARPVLKRDAAGRYLLRFDGVNDGIFTPYLPSGQTFPFTMVCAAKANADALGGAFGVWGGAPPYYEIQKHTTANQWRAFDRGAVNYFNAETGATASPHVLTLEMSTAAVNLRVDGTDPTAATTQDNLIGTITDIRVGNGGSGFFNGDFYGGVIRFGAMTAAQLSNVEHFLASKSGATVT